jgi:hypothetical protein
MQLCQIWGGNTVICQPEKVNSACDHILSLFSADAGFFAADQDFELLFDHCAGRKIPTTMQRKFSA